MNWVISLENGKLTRITFGNQNREGLKKREGCKAILTNVPSTAQEALLLRAICFTGAKSVYIPYNSNRNSSYIVKVFFESEEDRERVINRSINYYNIRLYWKENLVPHPKRYEEKKRIDRQRDADREVRQEQYLNTDIYNLLQKLSKRIEVIGKRGPNRS